MSDSTTTPFRPLLLALRPASTGSAQGGDEIMYRKSFPYLRERAELDVLELQPIGKFAKVLKLATMTPPECTRFISRANARAVATQLAAQRYDGVLLFNEVCFPMLSTVKRAAVPAVLIAQNVHSLVAATDPSPLARALRPLALAFERRFYADPASRLVAISAVDVAALRATGIARDDILVAPPGAPPAEPLAPDAPVLGEAIVTGSYDWWRKRRDLKSFAAGAPLGVPILASDSAARAILGEEAESIPDTPGFWSQGLRFGLVTDAFIGGFKLKSTEYVARNCVVLSMGDIAADFEGLPHAAEFVRILADKDAARAVIRAMRAENPEALVARFLEFKQACLTRFEWGRCLAPLGQAIAELPR